MNYLPEKVLNKIKTMIPDIVFIFLTGSRIINANDSKSDYDIQVVTKETIFPKIQFNNVSFLYQNISEYYTHNNMTLVNKPGPLLLYYVKREDLLYENPKYKKEIDRIFKNKDKLSIENATFIIKQSKKSLENFIGKKLFYRYCYIYNIIAKRKIATSDLIKIKHLDIDISKKYAIIIQEFDS